MKYEWYNKGFFPSYIGLFIGIDEFIKYGKEHFPDVMSDVNTSLDSAGLCYQVSHEGKHMVIVVINDIENNKDPFKYIPLVAHEVVHAKQYVMSHVGEDEVGAETEAYFVQHYTQAMSITINNYLESLNVVPEETSSSPSSPVDRLEPTFDK